MTALPLSCFSKNKREKSSLIVALFAEEEDYKVLFNDEDGGR